MQREKRTRKGGSHRGRGVWLAVAIVALVAATVCGFWLLGDRRSADERLAEIRAGRAVPYAENAALIYNELLSDPCAASLLDSHLGNLEESFVIQRRDEPWRSEDAPELAGWIGDCTPVFDRLATASRLDACRFPISIDVLDISSVDRFAPMLQWAVLLMFGVNNDLAEGRLDAAVTKWRCLIQLGYHLRQQPYVLDHVIANNATGLALKSLVRFVATGSPSARCLQEIEAMPFPLADGWPQHRAQIEAIDHLTELRMRESLSLWDRLKRPFTSYRLKRTPNKASPTPIERTGNSYRYNIATARGLRIVVALRRYHGDTAQWPEGLYKIEASLPEVLLTDPISGDRFVYSRLQDGFTLYSKGRNRIDEGGKWELEGADDWSIWPLPRPKPKPKPTSEESEEMMKKLAEIYGEDVVRRNQKDANGV